MSAPPPPAPANPDDVQVSIPKADPVKPAASAAAKKAVGYSLLTKVAFGLSATLFVLACVLVGLYASFPPKAPEVLTLCQFKLCEPLGHPEGSKACSAAVEAATRGPDAQVRMKSVLKFTNPNGIAADVSDWKVTLQWASSNGGGAALAACTGGDDVTSIAADADVEVPIECVISTRNNAVTAALEAYWEGASLGLTTKVEFTVTVLSVPLSASFEAGGP